VLTLATSWPESTTRTTEEKQYQYSAKGLGTGGMHTRKSTFGQPRGNRASTNTCANNNKVKFSVRLGRAFWQRKRLQNVDRKGYESKECLKASGRHCDRTTQRQVVDMRDEHSVIYVQTGAISSPWTELDAFQLIHRTIK
jgi:hypothetical protein